MKRGWYILNYHDISWEENAFVRGIGGSFPPDVFREHLDTLCQHARLVSIDEGLKHYREGTIDAPLVSFWFDDGFTGVRKYAKPLMDAHGVAGAISVNSRFALREEMFWRSKLSYLSQTDGLRFLRSRLKPLGYRAGESLKAFTMDRFSPEMIAAIDSVYNEMTDETMRDDAFRIFDTMEGLRSLQMSGWVIANHTSAHYPVSEAHYVHRFKAEFDECEAALRQHLGIETDHWVIPFDRDSLKLDALLKTFRAADEKTRHLVLVGDRYNAAYRERLIHRIEPPYLDGKALVRFLGSIPPYTS